MDLALRNGGDVAAIQFLYLGTCLCFIWDAMADVDMYIATTSPAIGAAKCCSQIIQD